jgi:hypothetical protein
MSERNQEHDGERATPQTDTATRSGEVAAQPTPAPSRPHGDALIDGSGSRQGVQERDGEAEAGR